MVLLGRTLMTLILSAGLVYGQDANIGQFAIWKPKDGQLKNFENGYKQHLNWHKSNGDKWSWYGWFIVSGPRYSQFVDATFDHSWTDFDNAVKPAEDMEDNRLHVFPFGDLQSIFKVSKHSKASTNDRFALKTKIVKMVTLTVDDIENALKIVERLKDFYVSEKIKTFQTFKVIDGGFTNQIIIMMGFDSWEEYKMSENLYERLAELEQNSKGKTFHLVYSETMVYRADLSLFPD